ncbi:MAG TPA: 50S ribosomal protein L30 [Gemmatimonadetes bacterium]|nr:50S ribosomal protein L30 [Gemmatimonadota bacterium]
MAKKSEVKKVRVTQKRSGIGRQEGHRRTIRALGIKRHQQSVVHELTPAIEGMI